MIIILPKVVVAIEQARVSFPRFIISLGRYLATGQRKSIDEPF